MIEYHVHRDGKTETKGAFDAEWLRPGSGVISWMNVVEPTPDEAVLLRDRFGVHHLAIEDALQEIHSPKVETYGEMLYVVLHGIDFRPERHAFDTADIDFFAGPGFLITVHDGHRRSIAEVASLCGRSDVLKEGPIALMHRIVDRMVEHYRPEVDELEERLDAIETSVVEGTQGELTAGILAIKRDISSMRRVVIPQRDIVDRLAGREFDQISQELSYRFRDVYDRLVRISDEAIIFQDRVTGILDAHLASVSNRLAQVSKLLAALAVIFGPLTVITGLFGMNVDLPVLPGGERAQFWWVVIGMGLITVALYAVFRRRGWL